MEVPIRAKVNNLLRQPPDLTTRFTPVCVMELKASFDSDDVRSQLRFLLAQAASGGLELFVLEEIVEAGIVRGEAGPPYTVY